MSRVGKKIIDIPAGVELKIDGNTITVKGPKGEFGLGLAIVDKILTLHKAKIYAENGEEWVVFIIEIEKEVKR